MLRKSVGVQHGYSDAEKKTRVGLFNVCVEYNNHARFNPFPTGLDSSWDGPIDGRIDGLADIWTDGQTNGQAERTAQRRADGRRDSPTDR